MGRSNIFSRELLSTIATFYCIRVASAALPLIVIPYAARILDYKNFSLFMYSLALGIWITMLIGYGDKLSGIRNIACQQAQPDKITHVISETLAAQGYLILLSAISVFLVSNLDATHNIKNVLWSAWAYGVAQGLNPLWIFQGMGKLKPLAFLEIFSNILILLLVFFILPAHAEYVTIMLIIILTRLLVNIVAYRLLFIYKVYIYHAAWGRSLFRLKQGFSLFFLIASVSLYTTLSTTILGIFSSLTMVGMFAGVEKLIRGFIAIILPISQAVIPHRYTLQDHPDQANILNKYITIVALSIAIIVSVMLYIFSQQWVDLFLGSTYHKASNILKILTWVIPCYVFSTILSSQYLIPNHKDNICTAIYFSGGIINTILAILLVPRCGAIGMSYSVLTAEFFVLISLLAEYILSIN